MTFRREWVSSFNASSTEIVSLGDGTVCEVKAGGTIEIER